MVLKEANRLVPRAAPSGLVWLLLSSLKFRPRNFTSGVVNLDTAPLRGAVYPQHAVGGIHSPDPCIRVTKTPTTQSCLWQGFATKGLRLWNIQQPEYDCSSYKQDEGALCHHHSQDHPHGTVMEDGPTVRWIDMSLCSSDIWKSWSVWPARYLHKGWLCH